MIYDIEVASTQNCAHKVENLYGIEIHRSFQDIDFYEDKKVPREQTIHLTDCGFCQANADC